MRTSQRLSGRGVKEAERMRYSIDIDKTIRALRECEAMPSFTVQLSSGARYLMEHVLLPFSEDAVICAEHLDFSRFDEDDVEELTDYAETCCRGCTEIERYAEKLAAQPCAADPKIEYFY